MNAITFFMISLSFLNSNLLCINNRNCFETNLKKINIQKFKRHLNAKKTYKKKRRYEINKKIACQKLQKQANVTEK